MKLPQDDFPLVVLSVSESDCHPEERSEEGSGLAFERPLTQILQACDVKNDTLKPL